MSELLQLKQMAGGEVMWNADPKIEKIEKALYNKTPTSPKRKEGDNRKKKEKPDKVA